MPPKVMATSRAVKNTDIGIDISVPSHEAASAPKLVKWYNVLVITTLPHFKEASHSEDSVVQFTVLQNYEAFEKLQKDMQESFPNLKLPSLPRKYHLFMSDSDIEERQIAFDCLLKVFCKEKVMCTSPIFLRFLGFNGDADMIYLRKRAEYIKATQSINDQSSDTQLFSTEKTGDPFDEEYTSPGNTIGEDMMLRSDSGMSARRAFAQKDLFGTDEHSEVADVEHSELLNVSDTVEDLLQRETHHAVVTENIGASNSIMDVDIANDESLHMQSTDDILAYIQTNTADNENCDVF